MCTYAYTPKSIRERHIHDFLWQTILHCNYNFVKCFQVYSLRFWYKCQCTQNDSNSSCWAVITTRTSVAKQQKWNMKGIKFCCETCKKTNSVWCTLHPNKTEVLHFECMRASICIFFLRSSFLKMSCSVHYYIIAVLFPFQHSLWLIYCVCVCFFLFYATGNVFHLIESLVKNNRWMCDLSTDGS